ncbi:MAG TPA: glycosyltransferase, partial [Candidatus Paceibacterota bacterium]|nr:glycosyltransferase [Candidatus Paceibacterota bacterium]
AISKTVQARIKKYYRRDSMVIYPPVIDLGNESRHFSAATETSREAIDTIGPKAKSNADQRGEIRGGRITHGGVIRPDPAAGSDGSSFYLIVSRLYEHKNVEIAVQAFNKLGYPLIIIGEGPEKKRLEKMASKNIIFLGRQDDEVVAEYYRSATAFIMPQEEDFGLTPLEAMSFGTPVIALRKGGATETLIEGLTGEFFDDPIPEGLADAVRRFRDGHYDPEKIKARAKEFSIQNFKKEIAAALQ